MAKQKNSKPSNDEAKNVVCPLVRVAGEKHLLEQIFEDETQDPPEIKSIGYGRLDKTKRHGWASYTITTKGTEVIKIEVSDPDMREIAEESAKEAFVTEFMDKDLM